MLETPPLRTRIFTCKNSPTTKLGPSPAAPSGPETHENTCRTHACRVPCCRPPLSAHVFLRARILALPSWAPRLPPRRGPKHVQTRAERTRAETHVADPPSPHTYFYVSNSASCCSTPLRWRASGPQTKREPWAGALTGKKIQGLPREGILTFLGADVVEKSRRWPPKGFERLREPPRASVGRRGPPRAAKTEPPRTPEEALLLLLVHSPPRTPGIPF